MTTDIRLTTTRRQALLLMGAAGVTTLAPSLAGLGAAHAQETPKGPLAGTDGVQPADAAYRG
jgi:hypothetical protein